VPILANIYRILWGLTSSRNPSHCRELVPWHFISGWLHIHWSGVYHPSLSSDLRVSSPILSDLAGTESASLTPEDARFRFYHSRDHLRLAHTRLATHHLAGGAYRSLIDATPSRDSAPLKGQSNVLDYFISLRHRFLPPRINDYAFIEPYSSHRCAYQFGLDHDVPAFFFHPESLAADLEGLGWFYSHLFRLETGSHFQMVPASHAPTFSRHYIWWYHDVIRSYQSYTPSVMAHNTCPRGRGSSSSDPTDDDFILFHLFFSEPVDFQGVDSRCPCLSTRTRLTGTFQIHFFLS
jgi:hypothetical protein